MYATGSFATGFGFFWWPAFSSTAIFLLKQDMKRSKKSRKLKKPKELVALVYLKPN